MKNQKITGYKNINSGRSLRKIAGLLLLGCSLLTAKAQADVLPQAVGPRPAGVYDTASAGSLIVYSSTEPSTLGEGPAYYPHSAYWIYNSAGKQIKMVQNHDSSTDETPSQVELAPGSYTIKAWSENDGMVTVPVVIKGSQVTNVHLEGNAYVDKKTIDKKQAVTTTSGQVVGWKA